MPTAAPRTAASPTASPPTASAPAAARRGPRTAEGRARSARNATRHGLRAGRFVLLPHEDPAEFAALAAAARAGLAPRCPLERELVEALAVALWRELRADRLEAEVLADIAPADAGRTCGSDLAEPAHRASLATLLRYRAQTALAVRRAQDALARHRRLVADAAATAAPGATAGTAATGGECTNEFPTPAGPGLAGPAPAVEDDGPAAARAAPRAGTNECPAADRPEPAPSERVGPDRIGPERMGPERVGPDGAPPDRASDPADPVPRPPGPLRLEPREAVRVAANPLDSDLLRALGRDPDLVLPVPGLRPEAWPAAQRAADPEGRPVDGQGPYRRVPHLPWSQWLAHQHLLPTPHTSTPRDEDRAA